MTAVQFVATITAFMVMTLACVLLAILNLKLAIAYISLEKRHRECRHELARRCRHGDSPGISEEIRHEQ